MKNAIADEDYLWTITVIETHHGNRLIDRRDVTRGLKAMIKRQSAIEPTIGHMKSDGRLGRKWLKGVLGHALYAAVCGAGHNLRIIMMKLQLLYADILVLISHAIEVIGIVRIALLRRI